jgi:aerobic carbon-monoxide dehydrogenase small subunit
VRIGWDSAEGHIKGFRRSPQLALFFELVKPFIDPVTSFKFLGAAMTTDSAPKDAQLATPGWMAATPVPIGLTVNGHPVQAEVEPRVLLSDFLRDQLGLTGTKVGCDTSQCGTCVVHMGDKSVKSCAVLAVQCDGEQVTTIEGVNPQEGLSPLQDALHKAHGTQCGFCTPGMVMSLMELLNSDPDPAEQDIRAWLTGNLCRCTGYHSVVRAVLSLADASSEAAGREMREVTAEVAR